MCITESLCCAPETNTILQINYISIKIKKKKKRKWQPSPVFFPENFQEEPGGLQSMGL